MARVFIGIPTRNRPGYVRHAIDSVLAQSFRDIRVVVSDNCSPEAAARDVREYVHGLGDARISYVMQPCDGQEYGQGRYLFGECREEYFCILHDDDLLLPGMLAEAVATLDRERDIGFFASGQRLIDESGTPSAERTHAYNVENRRHVAPEGRIPFVADWVLGAGIFSISGAVFRARTLRRCGLVDGDCEGLFPFEFNVFLRQAEHAVTAWYTRRELVAYRYHGGRQGSYMGVWYWNEGQLQTMTRLLERRRFSGRPERWRRRLLAKAHRNHAWILTLRGRRAEARALLARALWLEPWRPQGWAYAVLAVGAPGVVAAIGRRRARLLEG